MVNTMLAQRVEVGVGGVVPVEAKMGRPSSVWVCTVIRPRPRGAVASYGGPAGTAQRQQTWS
jgi:hypothetical protein